MILITQLSQILRQLPQTEKLIMKNVESPSSLTDGTELAAQDVTDFLVAGV